MIDLVLIDMDGVIADYYSVILQHTNATITHDEWPPGCKEYEHLFGMSYGDVMRNVDSNFWADIPATSWIHALLENVHVHPATVGTEAHILTSPPYVFKHEDIEPCHVADTVKGKLEWILRHIPDFYYDGRISFSWRKHIAASSRSLLIDDSEDNVNSFMARGGNAILIPGKHNKRHSEYDCLVADPYGWMEVEFNKMLVKA